MIRIGHGFDVHAFCRHRRLILAGVRIESEFGLAGHSDADVLTHAVMDSLLGALALGDIGHLFPDSDPTYCNADSLLLLKQLYTQEITHRIIRITNIDTTIVLQRPIIATYIPQMRQNLANTLGIKIEQVSIKATTTEKLGFIGRQEGIAAFSVVALEIEQ